MCMLHYIEDADENGYFDFQKPNGEVSRSFQSGKLIAVLLCAADAVDYYRYQVSLIDPSTESCCRQSLMISAINCSSRASELSCMINIVDQRQSSLSRSERPPFSYQVDNMFWWSICTHTHPFNGPLSRTTQVSRYQNDKTNLDFTEARVSEWQWHQLGYMQVCTSLQTDKHANTPPLSFLQAGCPSCHPANSVKAL